MNKYQEDFDLTVRLNPLNGREITVLNYGIEEGRIKAIDEFAERLRLECIEDKYNDVHLSQVFKIAEEMKKDE